ncbi:MAG: exo-alpha-sialidase, partial [Myxococcales bacterium]|nr:exo-alpha-sialidase [Myxococcales bacterium]
MGKVAVLLGTLIAVAGVAHAHFGEPRVAEVRFPPARGGEAWLVIDNVGLVARAPGEAWRWLCDESITPTPGLNSLAPLTADGRGWVAATHAGAFRTADDGCTFEAVPGALTEHVVALLSPDPTAAGAALLGTQTIGLANDVFRTTDGGANWTPAGLALEGRVRSLVRASADADVVYVGHTRGVLRSDDGGVTFAPIMTGPTDDPADAEDFRFLATHPADARDVFAVVEAFPDSSLVRSRDGGLTWATVGVFGDVPDGLVFLGDGQQAVLATPFDGLHRSDDGGDTWHRVPSPAAAVLSCLTREPATGRLWSCARGAAAPWLVGSSDDGGETWRPELLTFADLDGRWACPAGTPGATTCARACD